MNIFYVPDISGETLNLDESESNHALNVLRLKSGDRVIVMNGKGLKAETEILSINRKACQLRRLGLDELPPRPYSVHIVIAPTKMNDRMEWFLEKATEIGAEEITPVICQRSERRQVNHERYQKVLISAMKQSMNSWLPVLNEQTTFEKFLERTSPGFIAHCNDSEKLLLKNTDLIQRDSITILIGPEGDFTPGEVTAAESKGWQSVSLGSTRLRTETAGIVAVHTVSLIKS